MASWWVGGVSVVLPLLGHSVSTGGGQGDVHDQHGVLSEPLALLEGERRSEVTDDAVGGRLGDPNSAASCRTGRFVRQ